MRLSIINFSKGLQLSKRGQYWINYRQRYSQIEQYFNRTSVIKSSIYIFYIITRLLNNNYTLYLYSLAKAKIVHTHTINIRKYASIIAEQTCVLQKPTSELLVVHSKYLPTHIHVNYSRLALLRIAVAVYNWVVFVGVERFQ